jgi:hypothetical protein
LRTVRNDRWSHHRLSRYRRGWVRLTRSLARRRNERQSDDAITVWQANVLSAAQANQCHAGNQRMDRKRCTQAEPQNSVFHISKLHGHGKTLLNQFHPVEMNLRVRLARIFHTPLEMPTRRSRRSEEADAFPVRSSPLPHVSGYGKYEISGLGGR